MLRLLEAEAFRLLSLKQPDPAPGPLDDHGPRLGHLDSRIVGDRNKSTAIMSPLTYSFVDSAEVTLKVASPPLAFASSAQLGTSKRKIGVLRSGQVTLEHDNSS